MSTLNAAMRSLVDALQYPFRGMPSLVGVAVWSVVVGIVMLLVFKRTSDQDRLAAVKRRIHACLFEIRLFNDDLVAILHAQAEILRHNATYLRLSFKPLLWMIVPLVLLIGQLQYHYGYQPLRPGDRVLFKVELDQGWATAVDTAAPPQRPAVDLELPGGLEVDGPGVWIPELNEMDWRLTASAAGDYEVGVMVAGESFAKSVRVSDEVVRVSPYRPSTRLIDQLTWPAEPPLPKGGPIRSIAVGYPAAEMAALGLAVRSEYAWMVVFFVLSIVVAFILRKPFGVTI